MKTLNVVVGNTVDLHVVVNNLSDTPTEASIDLFRTNIYGQGLGEKFQTFAPDLIENGVVVFVFNTHEWAPIPGSCFGRFHILDNGKHVNAYFKLKLTY